ncbi:bifunctional phosphopantothenoylcysteine decarboxylase/phosphopantothenate--cysteine ligase CoaBC [Falsibacillus albus]|uniref:Coenzyme A biosynthesis bifunctional protein CoaBC n=1 Tax=Falsibacillus albus TaxID=2478915 RepID=A0A3L7JYH0_9BACI|nr:bifunctional phosphopantothenoylcysteine decarboxylase/phosphopantothenate--cysteine ligase CoaBC [Falsibacillus albus]RLQ95793.1 bifunctional phosphopantothenoylcysteine decarboxylase/phosphopantothenate--cysteine ligase CoaBC [Falsibacillus albus]
MLKGKNILLCVTGGIAAYKAAALTSKIKQAGADIKVIMSDSARQFIAPLTFQALSRNEVYFDTFDEKNPEVIAHIDLADWPDLIIVAPATANVIGKLANGIADNMITTTLLATKAPVWIAPAMNVNMYDHPAVQKNIQTLDRYGYQFIEPSEGYLACGWVGKGRLEEPEKIVSLIEGFFHDRSKGMLKGKRIIVTAGATKEKIDPIRYFTNRSSGKMGFAIAGEAAKEGAEVLLVTNSSLPAPDGVTILPAETAEDMYHEVMKHAPEADIIIKSAAVADYKPKYIYGHKMKKQDGDLVIELERTKDILKDLGEKKEHQFLVGFAAETENIDQYAMKKLQQKNADIIVANNVTQEGAGFAGDTNIVTIYKRDGSKKELSLMSKRMVAKELLNEIVQSMKRDR